MPVTPNRVMKRLLKRPHELAYNCSLHRGRLKDASFSAGTGLMASHPSAFRGRLNRSTQHFILDGKMECIQ
jgi:hypothetical protein